MRGAVVLAVHLYDSDDPRANERYRPYIYRERARIE